MLETSNVKKYHVNTAGRQLNTWFQLWMFGFILFSPLPNSKEKSKISVVILLWIIVTAVFGELGAKMACYRRDQNFSSEQPQYSPECCLRSGFWCSGLASTVRRAAITSCLRPPGCGANIRYVKTLRDPIRTFYPNAGLRMGEDRSRAHV